MSIETLITQILRKMSKVGQWQQKFLLHLFPLWLSLRGRYNFCHLARWGKYREDTYRNNFSRPFDWLEMNRLLVKESLSTDLVIGFDPSFLPKSGKHTPGLGYFYSGCAGRELRGLELCGLAAIDQSDKSVLHLEAVQTIDLAPDESLLGFYARIILERKDQLQQISRCIVADAYFSKLPFIDRLTAAGFEVITRLRKDVRLRYLYQGERKSGRGRPRKYEGRIDPYHLKEQHIRPCAQAEDKSWIAYELVANVQAWKRNTKIVIVHDLDQTGNIKHVRIYASTQPQRDGGQCLVAYHSRFQIELLYRDAKQHAGLTHCQARGKEKLHFHLNASLTAVSLAKVFHHIIPGNNETKPFSMADIKTQYANELLLDRFISTFGIDPDLPLIKPWYKSLRNLGKIAA